MITHNDYMKDSSNLHRQFYAQFVNDEVKNHLLASISKKELLNSKDEHLNDIDLKRWDLLGGFAFRGSEMTMRPTTTEPIDNKLLKEAGDGYSSATAVCIYKEAARQIIENK